MLDTNVFIAAFKSGRTKTAELLLELLTSPEYELVGNSVLLEEYRRWALRLSVEDPALQELAMALYSLLKSKRGSWSRTGSTWRPASPTSPRARRQIHATPPPA